MYIGSYENAKIHFLVTGAGKREPRNYSDLLSTGRPYEGPQALLLTECGLDKQLEAVTQHRVTCDLQLLLYTCEASLTEGQESIHFSKIFFNRRMCNSRVRRSR